MSWEALGTVLAQDTQGSKFCSFSALTAPFPGEKNKRMGSDEVLWAEMLSSGS